MFAFAIPRARRKPSLTPMIDVVFLLLVFFMLAARFGQDMAIPLSAGTGADAWQGAPRLIDLGRDEVRLNGLPVTADLLVDNLQELMPNPDAPVILRPGADVPLGALTDLLDQLRAGGINSVILVEGER